MSAPQATTGFRSHCMGGMEKQGGRDVEKGRKDPSLVSKRECAYIC